MNMTSCVCGLLLALLCGCASNPYSRFYHDYTGGKRVADASGSVTVNNPELRHGGNPRADADEMRRNGYDCIGVSSFNGAGLSESGAVTQAKRVRAEIVFVYREYTETLSGSTPLVLPDTKTSVSYGHASAYGAGGSASSFGSSTTTTYGTQTMYMPYNIRRFDYLATFWVKAKTPAFGAVLADLTSEQRRQIQSNKGVVVLIVMRGSPAFSNDVLEGDIIKRVNDFDVVDKMQCVEVFNKFRGKTVSLLLLRNGKEVQKQFSLNP